MTEFIEAALEDVAEAKRLWAEHPQLAEGQHFHAALVLGNAAAVKNALAKSPDAARTPGGPRQWEPLLYVCFSLFARPQNGRSEGFPETARLLLGAGANPNAAQEDPRWPGNPLPCLYAATGLNNNPALAGVLLEAGADPNDSESVYHSTEHPDLECLRLLLRHGARPEGKNALKHILDYEHLEGVHLLLAAGADPDETNDRGETALHWAVSRGRSPAVIRALLDAGASIDARRKDGRTAYNLAARTGQTETAELLKSRGADTTMPALDRFVAACLGADASELPGLVANAAPAPDREAERLLPEFAAHRSVSVVRALLDAGVPVDARGEHGGTALHWACWKGYPEMVELLLQRGASYTIEDNSFHARPAGWFVHGLRNCGDRRSDGDRSPEYAQVARLLVGAGIPFESSDLPTGDAEVDEVLRPLYGGR